jgi:DnaJ domain/Sel1 repeat
MKIHTYYDNLKVARTAPITVIKASYRVLSQQHHPDKNGNSDGSIRIMKIINQAYEVLSDPIQRAAYDEELRQKEAKAQQASSAQTKPPQSEPPAQEKPVKPPESTQFNATEPPIQATTTASDKKRSWITWITAALINALIIKVVGPVGSIVFFVIYYFIKPKTGMPIAAILSSVVSVVAVFGLKVILEQKSSYSPSDYSHIESKTKAVEPIVPTTSTPNTESDEVKKIRLAAEGNTINEQGDPDAQYKLGVRYADGQGVVKNEHTAVQWFQKAADQGFVNAQVYLGVMYSKGLGVVKNERTAVEWYTKAAEQGLAIAQYNLGVMYDNGRGVVKNERTAMQWFQKAAEQGLAEAQYNLGNMYANGRGVIKNEHTAVQWFQKAADQGDAQAQSKLGRMYALGNGVVENMKTAYFWWLIASTNGNENAKIGIEIAGSELTPAQKQAVQDAASKWRPKQ